MRLAPGNDWLIKPYYLLINLFHADFWNSQKSSKISVLVEQQFPIKY